MAIDMRFLDASQHDHIPDAVGLERVDQLVELADLDPMDPIDMLFELPVQSRPHEPPHRLEGPSCGRYPQR